LKDLAEGVPEDELPADATLTDGQVVKAEISWLGCTEEARMRLGAPVLLGTINIDNRKLIVNVNSTRRAETIPRLIEERLGNEAAYKTILLEPIESEIEKRWAGAAGAATGGSPSISEGEWAERTERSGVISLADAPAELRLRLEETAREHWIRWTDLPVPELNNMTPRKPQRQKKAATSLKVCCCIMRVMMLNLKRILCVLTCARCAAS
jgi:hypothetical protein